MMVGLPASGKSCEAKKLREENPDIKIRSSDTLREELLSDINDMSRNEEIFDLLHSIVKADLYNGYDTVFDATNLSVSRRKEFLESLSLLTCRKICIFVNVPFGLCMLRNSSRDREVPMSVMERMYETLQKPEMSEGWDEIREVLDDTN